MATKLESFLTEKKLDPRRVVAASRQIERLRREDRSIKLAYKQARKKEDGAKPTGLGERRSGRPVCEVTLRKAYAGKPISGATKTRILRAVNRLLEQKKQEPVAISTLFDA
jgi:hypothetical protein